ncbi:hypothetical protein MFFC18_24760 [Mariniblastus fucicola]|uniref:Uncharacterized protein n=1 Tax=Mariniblastus fucicola TaxID=980251 RepID=A0A5B9PJ44_9BACT|nr:hypothetical protein MFFC18_24760 [Mariniblastus fucicola]
MPDFPPRIDAATKKAAFPGPERGFDVREIEIDPNAESSSFDAAVTSRIAYRK